jgi:hypothetical protein
VFLAVCAVFTPLADASTQVRVTPEQVNELQTLIDESGDVLTLFMEPGVYDTCLEIDNGKTVNLIAAVDEGFEAICSATSPETVLTCDGLNTLSVEGTASLLGLTLRNSDRGRILRVDDGVFYGQNLILEPGEGYLGANENGAGISVERDEANVTLTHSVIRNLSTDNDGGAMWIDDGRVHMIESQICGTTAFNGGAVYMWGSTDSTPTLIGSNLSVTETLATGDGGAFYVGAKSLLQLVGGTVAQATATNTYSKGGAFYLYQSAEIARMTSVDLLANEAGYGGGIFIENGNGFADPVEVGVQFFHGTMTDNLSGLHGGGVYVDSGYAILSSVTMSGNHAVGSGVGYGGGAMVADDGFLESWGVSWESNLAGSSEGLVGATGEGGSVFVEEGYWVSIGDSWTSNEAIVGDVTLLDDASCGPAAGVAGAIMFGSFPPIVTNETCFAAGTITDTDGDGYAGGGSLDGLGLASGTDCDDGDATIHPGAVDTPYDGTDQDCDAPLRDDQDQDADGSQDDGTYGADVLLLGEDCNDLDPLVGPHAVDRPYDGVDQNCDGSDDDDADGDGYRSAEETLDGLDCDDLNESIHPGVSEVHYDGIDQDCVEGNEYDADGDGENHEDHGGLDCDDTDAAVGTFAEEVFYDSIDNDCDGAIGWDADGDGYDGCCPLADIETGMCDRYSCEEDCDDTDPTVHAGAIEQPDDVDHDCTGPKTEGFDPNAPIDSDLDGVNDYWEGLYGSNILSSDSDNDRISDLIEWGDPNGPPIDTDGDKQPDVLDTDTDDDTVDDRIEQNIDTDGDGIPNFRDTDDDGDGLDTLDEYQGGVDTDGDGVSDYLDRDSDNDSAIDGSDPNPQSAGGNFPLSPAQNKPPAYGFGCSTGPLNVSGAWWMLTAMLIGSRIRRRED